MARKLYPIGIQTFERIRKEDKFYVDKTECVYRMAHTDGTYSTCTVADASEIGCCSSPRSPSVGIINKRAYIISDNFAIIA